MLLIFIEPHRPNTVNPSVALRHIVPSKDEPDHEARDIAGAFVARFIEENVSSNRRWFVEVLQISACGKYRGEVGVGRFSRPELNGPIEGEMIWQPLATWPTAKNEETHGSTSAS